MDAVRTVKKPQVYARISTGPSAENFLDEWHLDLAAPILERKSREGETKREDVVVPKSITGKYVKDFNILKVHVIMLEKFRRKEEKLPLLRKRAQELAEVMQKPQSLIERYSTAEKHTKLLHKIERIESGTDKNLYLREVTPLLNQYKNLGFYMRKVAAEESWGEGRECGDETDPKTRERLVVIESYLRAIQPWIQVDVVREIPGKGRCEMCGEPAEVTVNETRGTVECAKCGLEKPIYISSSQSKESTKTATSQRNDYNNLDNFVKAFMRYQGLQSNEPPKELFDALDVYFRPKETEGVTALDLRGETVRKLPLQSNRRRGRTDHQMLYKALADTGYTDYYEDANLIGHRYWGWELPNVLSLMEVVISDYKKTQRVYSRIPKERSSSLGTQYRLFKHLQMRGHPCEMTEFKIAENRESIAEHDDLWRQMCEGAEDPSIFFIRSV